jgi:hypothetical protein
MKKIFYSGSSHSLDCSMVVGFEILMVVIIKSNISWDMRLCSDEGVY